MTFEEIRQELFRLNDLHNKTTRTDYMRVGVTDPSVQATTPRAIVEIMEASNPEHVTWDDVNREVAALEDRIVRETGFGIIYWFRKVDGEEIAGSYALVPKNDGWLEAKRDE